MSFRADLHIHSRHSLATSKQSDLPHLWAWAQKKGITLVGTGDFTHPAWIKSLKEQLEPAEPGLFRLKDAFRKKASASVPESCKGKVRFILSSEISSIYKKNDKTRKVHNLLYAPDFDEVDRISKRLDAIGNIKSDGRPILGLDSKELLRIAIEADRGTFLIPAHIWTPWFSVLGSKSGFDSIEECYEELSDHVFAVETGLSSDPPMNWRLSKLDRFALVSNSDAHSPNKLGRNATVFDCDMSFEGLATALRTRKGLVGTMDSFPELGKYHLDGHRKCDVRYTPAQTRKAGGLCSECGKPVTVGVVNRVDTLADHTDGRKPKNAAAFQWFMALPEALAQAMGKGVGTKTVQNRYEEILADMGPEFEILLEMPLDAIKSRGGDDVFRLVRDIRKGKFDIRPGFDGQFGAVRLTGIK